MTATIHGNGSILPSLLIAVNPDLRALPLRPTATIADEYSRRVPILTSGRQGPRQATPSRETRSFSRWQAWTGDGRTDGCSFVLPTARLPQRVGRIISDPGLVTGQSHECHRCAALSQIRRLRRCDASGFNPSSEVRSPIVSAALEHS